MAVIAYTFTKVIDSLAEKKINLATDTLKCMLMQSFSGSQTYQYLSDAKAGGTEASGTGYTAGGNTLVNVTWGLDNGVWRLRGQIPEWDTTGGSLNANYAIFYSATPGSDATNPLICYWDLGGGAPGVTSTNGIFTLTPHADGIATFTILN